MELRLGLGVFVVVRVVWLALLVDLKGCECWIECGDRCSWGGFDNSRRLFALYGGMCCACRLLDVGYRVGEMMARCEKFRESS